MVRPFAALALAAVAAWTAAGCAATGATFGRAAPAVGRHVVSTSVTLERTIGEGDRKGKRGTAEFHAELEIAIPAERGARVDAANLRLLQLGSSTKDDLGTVAVKPDVTKRGWTARRSGVAWTYQAMPAGAPPLESAWGPLSEKEESDLLQQAGGGLLTSPLAARLCAHALHVGDAFDLTDGEVAEQLAGITPLGHPSSLHLVLRALRGDGPKRHAHFAATAQVGMPGGAPPLVLTGEADVDLATSLVTSIDLASAPAAAAGAKSDADAMTFHVAIASG